MYKQRQIPTDFDVLAEVICLMTSIVASKIRAKEFEKYEIEHYLCPFVITRAYQKLFPAFEVHDGVVARFGQRTEKPEYGEAGYFHYHENRSRPSIACQVKLIPHARLIFKESLTCDLPSLGVDILPIGSINNRVISIPFCLDEHAHSFVKTSLPRDVDEKNLLKNVRVILPSLEAVKEEVEEML